MSITTEVERDIFQTDTDISGNLTLINGNVGIGTTAPLCSLYNFKDTTTGWAGMSYFGNNTSGVVAGAFANVAYLGGHNGALNAWTDLAINPGNTGNVGIRTTSPQVPLDVRGSNAIVLNSTSLPVHGQTWSWNIHQHYGAGGGGSLTLISNSTSNSVGIYSEYNFLTAIGYLNSSDRRIKKDIVEVNDSKALDMVNKIECKEYHYLDPLRQNEMKTIGFIAQEVKEVFPNAVSLQNEYIPDELRVIENPVWTIDDSGNNILILNDLDISSNHTGNCYFYVSNDPSGNDEVKLEIMVENDKKSFIFEQKWNNIILWSKQVNDFHSLDKNQIFALHHSAIQELSRRNDAKEQRIQQLETENSQLKSDMALVKQKLGL